MVHLILRFVAILVIIGLAIGLATTGCASNDETSRQFKEQPQSNNPRAPLVGSYYQGDYLGYNFHLTLEQDGSFDCQWTGCLGNYGSTSGTWSLDGDRITVNATESNGMFTERALGNMTIIKHQGKTRLLRDTDAELLKDDPDMLQFFSFGRVEPEDGRTIR